MPINLTEEYLEAIYRERAFHHSLKILYIDTYNFR